MWIRNILFLAVCLAGGAALAALAVPGGWDDLAAATGVIPTSVDRLGGSPGEQSVGGEEELAAKGQPSGDGYDREVAETVAKIDREFRAHWSDEGLATADRAAPLTVARRLSLGLTGTIPSLEEIRQLEGVAPENRVRRWTDHLLADRRYADHVGERLARAYVGTENGAFIVFRRRVFVNWLSDRLAENQPYDELVRSLITGVGLWTDKPAVNFLTATASEEEDNQPDPVRLAGRTSRAFLGMRIDCLACHDDKLGTIQLGDQRQGGDEDDSHYGLQQDFHMLAAFFSESNSSLLGVRDTAKPYRYTFLGEEKEEVVLPQPPYRADLLTKKGARRARLADWVTHPENKPFARAMVNRTWALLFSRPLVEPIDDIPLHGPFPPGLETLAEDFAAHGFDLQRLIRTIAATEVFQLDSRADHEVLDEHEANWAVFPLTRLRPEQVVGSLIQASSVRTIDANSHIFVKLARYNQQNEFVNRYGDTGEDEFEDRGGTIPQRLLMMNGALTREKTGNNLLGGNASAVIAALAPDDETAVETAYLAILSRRPAPREMRRFVERFTGEKGDKRADKMADLYWVLLNSAEFSWNH